MYNRVTHEIGLHENLFTFNLHMTRYSGLEMPDHGKLEMSDITEDLLRASS